MAKIKARMTGKQRTEARRAAEELSEAMVGRLKALEPADPRTNAVLQRIGVALRNRMIANATRERIIDTGALRASINYAVQGNRVLAGTFGVRYARFHEFGATLSPRGVRAMFAAMRKRGSKGGPKGVFTGNPVTGGTLRARPFVRPALEMERARILAMLRQYAKGE